ncbi:hypothetical protein HQ487_02990 [Candidatus Uhrbacteria bacterium]|nr:hypothetical protein [Candidatus Uhrbacteria bacterium]
MKFLTRIIQLFIVAIPIGIMCWLLSQWIVPSGGFFVSHVVGEDSPFVDALQPEIRVADVEKSNAGESVQAILEDPVFFFVHPHRDFFDEVVIDVWFQNETVPIVELGGLVRTNPDVYSLFPLHNRLIDESTWSRMDEGGLVLLQKEKTYDSISSFLADPPAQDAVAVYRTELDVSYRLEGYVPTQELQQIDVSLRGHHEFKTYIKNEVLDFTFYYMDMNRDEGADVVQITVFNEAGQPVAEARAADDGNIQDDSSVDQGLKELHLTAYGLPEGVYKVVMNVPRDIFFRKIVTPQQKIVFLNTVFIGDEVGFKDSGTGGTFYTQSKRLRLQTRHAEGVQTLVAGSQTLEIQEPYVWYVLSFAGEGLEKVTLPKGDVEIVTEGTYSFSPSQYFNPDPVSLNSYTTIEQLGVSYVLAKYESPRKEGNWLVARVRFIAWDLYQESQTWKFSFSTPLIKELDASLLIHQIDILFNQY